MSPFMLHYTNISAPGLHQKGIVSLLQVGTFPDIYPSGKYNNVFKTKYFSKPL